MKEEKWNAILWKPMRLIFFFSHSPSPLIQHQLQFHTFITHTHTHTYYPAAGRAKNTNCSAQNSSAAGKLEYHPTQIREITKVEGDT